MGSRQRHIAKGRASKALFFGLKNPNILFTSNYVYFSHHLLWKSTPASPPSWLWSYRSATYLESFNLSFWLYFIYCLRWFLKKSIYIFLHKFFPINMNSFLKALFDMTYTKKLQLWFSVGPRISIAQTAFFCE